MVFIYVISANLVEIDLSYLVSTVSSWQSFFTGLELKRETTDA